MATYAELIQASQDSGLRDKIKSAIGVAAETIRTESGATGNHANRLIWAKQAFNSPASKVDEMTWCAVIQNRAATLAQITGASDASIQTAVNAAVDVFATGS